MCLRWIICYWFNTGFLSSEVIDIWGWRILGCGGCSVPCRTFSSIPGLYPVDASSTSPTMTITNVSNMSNVWRLKNLPLVENCWLDGWTGTCMPWRRTLGGGCEGFDSQRQCNRGFRSGSGGRPSVLNQDQTTHQLCSFSWVLWSGGGINSYLFLKILTWE